MKENLISIIVPIYKTEAYLEKCIQSILAQTYTQIEVLLVMDTISEEAETICQKYKKLDNRVRVIDIPERVQVGEARNVGIENATGKYIGFVDSDDYIEKDMYEVLLKNLLENEADISVIEFWREENGKIVPKQFTNQLQILDRRQALREVLKDKRIQSYVWNKLFKKEIWETTKFSKDKVFEDIEVIYKIFLNVNRVAYMDTPKYIYVQRSNSIMHEHNSRYILDRLDVIAERYYALQTIEDEEVHFMNEYAFVVNMIVIFRNIVLQEYHDTYEAYMKYYDMFLKMVIPQEERMRKILTPNQNLVLDFMLEDIETASEKIKKVKDIDK